MTIEHEVKLGFPSVEAARQAVNTAGGRLEVSRRRLDDRLFDTADGHLRQSGCALRLRRDGSRALVTFKGPVQAGPVKSREELETDVGDASVAEAILTSLGYRQVFRAEKYREEFLVGEARVTIDETPIGVFVEIEAAPAAIGAVTTRLGRTPADHRLDSYVTLWDAWCRAHGRPFGDMTFEAAADRR